MIAFVIGNGESRKNINPDKLKKYGTVFGCNAVYRNYSPDYLIAVDSEMIKEITQHNYQNTHSVWTNPHKDTNDIEGINFFNPNLGWSSGPTALNMAVEKGFEEIYVLGFDFGGIDGKFNNVYKDTQNYRSSSDSPTFYGNWVNQIKTILDSTDTKIYRVINKEYQQIQDYMPELSWEEIEMAKFVQKFGHIKVDK